MPEEAKPIIEIYEQGDSANCIVRWHSGDLEYGANTEAFALTPDQLSAIRVILDFAQSTDPNKVEYIEDR